MTKLSISRIEFTMTLILIRIGFVPPLFGLPTTSHMEKHWGSFLNLPKQSSFLPRGIRTNSLKNLEEEKVTLAFKNKRGLCLEFSRILKKLYDILDVESQIVRGVVKEEIKDVSGDKIYKNHAWNAVKLNGEWILMDPTWASGYYDDVRKIQVQQFNGRYFDVEPNKLIKDHFPSDPKWQLLEKPVSLNTFYSAPIFLPGYFENNIVLSSNTSGLLSPSENFELIFAFEKIPLKTQLRYSIDTQHNSGKSYPIKVKKTGDQTFISKLKLNKALKDGKKLTLYIDQNPILLFQIDP